MPAEGLMPDRSNAAHPRPARGPDRERADARLRGSHPAHTAGHLGPRHGVSSHAAPRCVLDHAASCFMRSGRASFAGRHIPVRPAAPRTRTFGSAPSRQRSRPSSCTADPSVRLLPRLHLRLDILLVLGPRAVFASRASRAFEVRAASIKHGCTSERLCPGLSELSNLRVQEHLRLPSTPAAAV